MVEDGVGGDCVRFPRQMTTLREYGHNHALTYVADDQIISYSDRNRDRGMISVVYERLNLGDARIVRRITTPREPRETRAARKRSGSLSKEQVVIRPSARTRVISSTCNQSNFPWDILPEWRGHHIPSCYHVYKWRSPQLDFVLKCFPNYPCTIHVFPVPRYTFRGACPLGLLFSVDLGRD